MHALLAQQQQQMQVLMGLLTKKRTDFVREIVFHLIYFLKSFFLKVIFEKIFLLSLGKRSDADKYWLLSEFKTFYISTNRFCHDLITSFGHINLILGVKIEYNELSSDHKNN